MFEERMCRHCERHFTPSENHSKACRYHPESFTGETAQRWAAPGDTKNGRQVHYFWSCCGSNIRDSPGCCYISHVGFGETQSIDLRRPGMGVDEDPKPIVDSQQTP